MGLLTVDVVPFGVVMACDSQPVEMYAHELRYQIAGAKTGSHVVRARASRFSGWAGYTGTEVIDQQHALEWLGTAVEARSASTLETLCSELAEELTLVWAARDVATHLSIFVAGYEEQEPRFWFVSNGDVPDGSAPIPRAFEAVDDLGGRFSDVNTTTGETLEDLVARTTPSFRRGVLAAADIFDGYTALVGNIMNRHPEIPLLDVLNRYASYTRFRFEFTKRMYDPKYGLGTDPVRPLAGKIHVHSVDPSGVARTHGKYVTDTVTVA